MISSSHVLLREPPFSLNHEKLADIVSQTENLLIIQDLDGVCMGLVKNPLTRVMDMAYVEATRCFAGHFYVLTNGEHIGQRGVNAIIDKALGNPTEAQDKGLYLPGLAAGGVQWQDCYGNVSHPGVSEKELSFLELVPQRIEARLRQFFQRTAGRLDANDLDAALHAAVLDNKASPTANLNIFYERLQATPEVYIALQQDIQALMLELLEEATAQGMADAFFVHYAPNLGRDLQGLEIMRPAIAPDSSHPDLGTTSSGTIDSGTTDFQFMLQGAVKEAGVLAILNRYYFQRTGEYPLGKDFNARQAPKSHAALLDLVKTHFDPAQMPLMLGVGDTVTSHVEEKNGCLEVQRGGSDRNFLQLIQDIGQELDQGNIVIYVDSSRGEVKNRRSIQVGPDPNGSKTAGDTTGETTSETTVVLAGPCDPRDRDEPLLLNVVFPGGHEQYIDFFRKAAQRRQNHGLGDVS